MGFSPTSCSSTRKIKKLIIVKECTRPTEEFLIRKCRNNRKMKNVIIFFIFEKNLDVQPKSFYYINVETMGECKNKKIN